MTIQIDDAGYGDLLFGVVIGAYQPETDRFIYDVVDVRFFQVPLFEKKTYLDEAGHIALRLVERLAPEDGERMEFCRGDILDRAAEALEEAYGDERVIRAKVEGRAQHLVEEAYLDEISTSTRSGTSATSLYQTERRGGPKASGTCTGG